MLDLNFYSKLFDKLLPFPRSITGDGFRESLKILGQKIDLTIFKFKSGTRVLDWKIPKEWNIQDGYIIGPSGKKIADFKKHSLHVVNYSEPIKKKIKLIDLKKRLFFSKDNSYITKVVKNLSKLT